MFPFLPHNVHSCSTSGANTHPYVIKLVNQLPIHRNPRIQSVSQPGRQAVSHLGQTREQLAATFNSLRLPGLASTASDKHISAKYRMWQQRMDRLYPESEVKEGIGPAKRCSKRSASTNLWLSILKSLAIISPSLWSWRDDGGTV